MIDSGSDIAIQLQDLLKPLQFIHQHVIISHTTKSVTDLRVALRGLYDSSFQQYTYIYIHIYIYIYIIYIIYIYIYNQIVAISEEHDEDDDYDDV